jgi:hypothetical protein
MAGSRTLKLSILGDVDNLNKSLKTATKDVDTFGDKISKTGKMIGAAFVAAAAAAGAYAVKIGIDGVKAAIEDEKAQTQLARALEAATGATKGQIAATEASILQMSLASGVADDELRPALQRIALSTGSLTKAQDLLSVALDVATATGKPLETVANALGRAYDGNTASLGKLGIGLSAAELKTMSFNDVQSKLTELFGGAASANAETYSGRIARMQVAFDEAKETIGFALLPILEKVMKFINENALPIITAFSNAFSLKGGGLGGVITNLGNIIVTVFSPILNGLVKAFGYVKKAIGENMDEFKTFAGFIVTYVAPVIGEVLGGALQVVGKIASAVVGVIGSVVKVINNLIQGAIDGINALIKAYNAVNLGLPDIKPVTGPSANSSNYSSISGVLGSSSPKTPPMPTITIPTVTGAGSGIASASSSAVKAASSKPFTGSSDAAASRVLTAGLPTAMNVTINQGVVGDPEGAARSIVDVLNRSYGRGGLGAEALLL